MVVGVDGDHRGDIHVVVVVCWKGGCPWQWWCCGGDGVTSTFVMVMIAMWLWGSEGLVSLVAVVLSSLLVMTMVAICRR